MSIEITNNNIEKAREYRRKRWKKYYQKNKEKIKEQSKKYRKANPKKIKEYQKNWREKNREYKKEYHKKYYKKYYQENLEKERMRGIKYRQENKEKERERKRQYFLKNPEYQKKYRKKNKEKMIEYYRKYRQENRERRNRNKRRYYKIRIKTDPKYKLDKNMGTIIYQALRGKKAGRSWKSLVGYSIKDLMTHLEKQFEDWMTWNNYGKWHIDHIKPKSLFNYETAEDPEFKKCWNLENLQPLEASENRNKGNKY